MGQQGSRPNPNRRGWVPSRSADESGGGGDNANAQPRALLGFVAGVRRLGQPLTLFFCTAAPAPPHVPPVPQMIFPHFCFQTCPPFERKMKRPPGLPRGTNSALVLPPVAWLFWPCWRPGPAWPGPGFRGAPPGAPPERGGRPLCPRSAPGGGNCSGPAAPGARKKISLFNLRDRGVWPPAFNPRGPTGPPTRPRGLFVPASSTRQGRSPADSFPSPRAPGPPPLGFVQETPPPPPPPRAPWRCWPDEPETPTAGVDLYRRAPTGRSRSERSACWPLPPSINAGSRVRAQNA